MVPEKHADRPHSDQLRIGGHELVLPAKPQRYPSALMRRKKTPRRALSPQSRDGDQPSPLALRPALNERRHREPRRDIASPEADPRLTPSPSMRTGRQLTATARPETPMATSPLLAPAKPSPRSALWNTPTAPTTTSTAPVTWARRLSTWATARRSQRAASFTTTATSRVRMAPKS